MDEGYCYLMVCAPHNTFKIGWSRWPKERFEALHAANPSLMLLWCFPGDKKLESWLHKQFSEYRVFAREWYHVPPEELTKFLFSMAAVTYFFSTLNGNNAYSCEEMQPFLQTAFKMCHTKRAQKILVKAYLDS